MKKYLYVLLIFVDIFKLFAGGGSSKMVPVPQQTATSKTSSSEVAQEGRISAIGFSVAPSFLNNKQQMIYVKKINDEILPIARFTKGEYEFALLDAAKNNKHQAFIILLELPEINVNLTDVTGETLLMLAAKHGDGQAVSLLLGKGANLNAVNTFITPHKTVQDYAIASASDHPQIKENKKIIKKMLENYKKERHANIVKALDELSLHGPTNDIAKIIESY